MNAHPGAEDRTLPEVPPPQRQAPPLFAGRYETERLLGSGQMGEVFRVRDRQTGARLALKRVPPALVRDASQFHAVRANFELVSRLAHPHIASARTLEVVPATGEALLLMDLVDGVDLGTWLAQRRRELGGPAAALPVAEALGIAEQIAAALDHAHGLDAGAGAPRGILHRDLKPANAMVEAGREFRPGVPFVRLVDFGLAAEIQGSLMSLSQPGVTSKAAGTPVYMAPEQFEGRTLTRGVDQWALAVMTYEMLAGRRPFQSADLGVLMHQVMYVTPEPPPALGDAQWAELKRGLAVDRRRRHRSCLALVHAVAKADPALSGSMTLPEIALPDEFSAEPSSHGAPSRPSAPATTPAAAPTDPHGGRRLAAPAPPPEPGITRAPRLARLFALGFVLLLGGVGYARWAGLVPLSWPMTPDPEPVNDAPPVVPWELPPEVDDPPVDPGEAPPQDPPVAGDDDEPMDDSQTMKGESTDFVSDRPDDDEGGGDEADLVAPWSATVQDLPYPEGAFVAQGTALFQLSDPAAELERIRADAGREAAAAEREEAEQTRDRIRALHEQGLATRAALDEAETALALAQAKLVQAGAAAALAAEHLRRNVIMPFDGVIEQWYVEVGEMAVQGEPLLRVRRLPADSAK